MNSRTIAYWGTTGLLALAALGSGIGKLTAAPPLVENMEALGYPLYLMTILGVAYVAAAITLLAPGLPRLKEWAYAGLTFAFLGAAASHVAVGDPVAKSVPVVALLGVLAASYRLRGHRAVKKTAATPIPVAA